MRPKTALRKRVNFGLVCVLPWLFGFCVFTLYPFLYSLFLSLTNKTVLKDPIFIGLTNYVNIFTKDPIFWRSFGVTLVYSFVSVPLKLAFALAIATVLNQRLRHIGVFRTIYYLPSIIGSSVALAAAWKGLFSYDGAINSMLQAVGLPIVGWFSEPVAANVSLMLLNVWQFGSSMVIFLAGLKGIPTVLYEAARIDGAGPAQSFFRITLPQLSPVIFFNLIMQSINALQEFAAPMLITSSGGPMKATYLYGLKLYEEGFQFGKMGYASASSWIMFLVILILTTIAFRSSGWVHYEDGGAA